MGLDKDSPESLQHADANLSPEAEMGCFLAARCSSALEDSAAGVLGPVGSDYHISKVDSDYHGSKVDPDYHGSKVDPDYPSSKADPHYQSSKADSEYRLSEADPHYQVSKMEPDCRISHMSEPDFSRISNGSEPDCRIPKVSEADCRIPNLTEGEDRAEGEELSDLSPASGHRRVTEREGEEEGEGEEVEEEEGRGGLMGSRRERESRSPEVDCPAVSSSRVFSPPMHTGQPLFV